MEEIKDLPEAEFANTRQAILNLLTELFPKRSMKWKSVDIPKNMIDITTYEIARIWRPKVDVAPESLEAKHSEEDK